MACYSQTCLLDVSELSGQRLFPIWNCLVYRFKEFHRVSLFSRMAPWYPVFLGKGRSCSLSRLSGWHWWYSGEHSCLQITWVLGLVSVTREPLWQSGCSLHMPRTSPPSTSGFCTEPATLLPFVQKPSLTKVYIPCFSALPALAFLWTPAPYIVNTSDLILVFPLVLARVCDLN